MNIIESIKKLNRTKIAALLVLGTLATAGGVKAYEAYNHDCCSPGASCCHPGADCCAKHRAGNT